MAGGGGGPTMREWVEMTPFWRPVLRHVDGGRGAARRLECACVARVGGGGEGLAGCHRPATFPLRGCHVAVHLGRPWRCSHVPPPQPRLLRWRLFPKPALPTPCPQSYPAMACLFFRFALPRAHTYIITRQHLPYLSRPSSGFPSPPSAPRTPADTYCCRQTLG